MNRSKIRLILLIIAVIIIGGIVLNKLLAPKDTVEKYNRKITSLTKDLQDLDKDIDKYFKNINQKSPPYLFLMQTQTTELKKYITEKNLLEIKLADYLTQKGDYFYLETYRMDKKAPKIYRSLDNISLTTLKHRLHQKQSSAQEYVQLLIETRKIAIQSYKEAMKVRQDESSDLFSVNKKALLNKPIPLKQINNESTLSTALKDLKILSKYLTRRVKSSLHNKLGLCYRQLANISVLLKKNPSEIEKYTDLAQKEFLIALLAQKDYYKVLYNLAELYTFKYQTFKYPNMEFDLKKAEDLLVDFVTPSKSQATRKDILGNTKDKEITVIKSSLTEQVDSYFLLAKIYYLMGQLEDKQIINIRKVFLDFGKNGTKPLEIRLILLKKGLDVYQLKLMKIINKKHPRYSSLIDNYNKVKNEIDKLTHRR